MLDAAKNLEFEKAAQLRDRLIELKEAMFGVALPGRRLMRFLAMVRAPAMPNVRREAPTAAARSVAVLFVCLGNICRSPTAEGVFRVALDRAGLAGRVRTASAGLGRLAASARRPTGARSRRRSRRGYDLYDVARAARSNRRISRGSAGFSAWTSPTSARSTEMKPPEFAGHLGLLLDFAPEHGVREVPDPYYGGPDGFDRVLDLIEASTAGLVARLQPIARDALTQT